jgi:ribonuclease HI
MFTYVDHEPRIDVYTDGSAIDNDTDDVKAGAGVYFGEGDPRNRTSGKTRFGIFLSNYRQLATMN